MFYTNHGNQRVVSIWNHHTILLVSSFRCQMLKWLGISRPTSIRLTDDCTHYMLYFLQMYLHVSFLQAVANINVLEASLYKIEGLQSQMTGRPCPPYKYSAYIQRNDEKVGIILHVCYLLTFYPPEIVSQMGSTLYLWSGPHPLVICTCSNWNKYAENTKIAYGLRSGY